jgi:hypothetical protein
VGDVNVETLLGKAATWVQWAATNLGGGLGFWVLLAIALGVVAAAILSTLGDLIKAFLATHTGTLLGLGLPALIAAGSVVGFDDQVTNVAVWLPAIVGFAVGGAWAASTYLKRWSRWQRHAAWAFGVAYPAALLVAGYASVSPTDRPTVEGVAVVMPADASALPPGPGADELSFRTFNNLHLSLESLSRASEKVRIVPASRTHESYRHYVEKWGANPLEIHEFGVLTKLGHYHRVPANDVDVIIAATVSPCDETGSFFRVQVLPYPVERESARASEFSWHDDLGVYGQEGDVELIGLVVGFELARVLASRSEDLKPLTVTDGKSVRQFRAFLKGLVDRRRLSASAEDMARLADPEWNPDASDLREIMLRLRERLDARAARAKALCEEQIESTREAITYRLARG